MVDEPSKKTIIVPTCLRGRRTLGSALQVSKFLEIDMLTCRNESCQSRENECGDNT